MFVHRIKPFQERTKLSQNFHIYFIAVFANQLLGFSSHIICICLRITGITDYGISAYCNGIYGAFFFIESHIHLVRHNKITLMCMDLLVQDRIYRLCQINHDHIYHSLTAWKRSYQSNDSPDRISGTKVDPHADENKNGDTKHNGSNYNLALSFTLQISEFSFVCLH